MSHEDFPRHIYLLFLLLCIQFRWLLTRCTLACALVTPAELAIINAKEADWMEMYDHDRDTLEDILYHRLQDLWVPLTDSMKMFAANSAAQPLCAQKVWEALLTAFPLDHKRMQTALLARELARIMRWDGDSKRAVNLHFADTRTIADRLAILTSFTVAMISVMTAAKQPRVASTRTSRATRTDDHPFIVLTETKFSSHCIPVWDRYSPYRTRV